MRIDPNSTPPVHRKRKFYAEDVAEWAILHKRGWSYRQLGIEWGVSPATICQALSGKYLGRIVPRPAEGVNSASKAV